MNANSKQYARVVSELHPRIDTSASALAVVDASGIRAALRQMQTHQADVHRALMGSIPNYSDVFKPTFELHRLSIQESLGLRMVDEIHKSWRSVLDGLSVPRVHVQDVAKMALSDISYDLAFNKRYLFEFNYEALSRHLGIHSTYMSQIQRSMSAFSASYSGLVKSFQGIDQVVKSPSFLLPGATREVSATSHALHVLRPAEDLAEKDAIEREPYPSIEHGLEASGLEALLDRVDPSLVNMYRGAVASLNGKNPDRARHVLTSLRELWNHVFRAIAPQEEVKKWVQGLGIHTYLHDGQPTRQAKIRYISKDTANEPLADFVDADTKAMLKLYDLYGRLHKLESGVTDAQLRTIVCRTESHLIYILRVRECSNE